jgi:A118 family predicted phage portal protein
MMETINLWDAVYRDNAPWVVRAEFESLNTRSMETRRSLNLGAAISRELSRLTCLELATSLTEPNTETGTESGEPPNPNSLQRSYDLFITDLRKNIEYAMALGGCVFKPYTSNEVGQSQPDVYVAVVPATQFWPCAMERDGTVTECVIAQQTIRNNSFYTLLEYRKFDFATGTETIRYQVYMSPYGNNLGNQVPLSSVPEWSHLKDDVISGLEQPLFVYWKPPFANTVDPASPLGISVYANALQLIEDADIQYSRYLWEYKAAEFAIMVDASAIEYDTNRNMNIAKLDRRIYKGIDIKDLFKEWNPSLRDSSYYSGLNNILRLIEFNCGLSYSTLSDANDKVLTATEIIASRQRSYGTVHEIQVSLETAIKRLILVLCKLTNTEPQTVHPIFEWDDSIIVDIEVEKNLFMQEIAAGLRLPWEYRVRFLGETEAEAKRILSESEEAGEEESLTREEIEVKTTDEE